MVTATRDRELLTLIVELGRAGRGLQSGEVFCAGVTFTQFYILDLVAREGHLPLTRVHDELGVDKSTTTRLVAPLIERGLVERRCCATDARARDLVMTPAGTRELERVWRCLDDVLARVREELPADDALVASVRGFLDVVRRVCAPGCC